MGIFSNFGFRNQLGKKFIEAGKDVGMLQDLLLYDDWKRNGNEYSGFKIKKANKDLNEFINWFDENLELIKKLYPDDYDEKEYLVGRMRPIAKKYKDGYPDV